MKQLGSLTLPHTLLWSDRFTGAPVQQTLTHTLGGTPVLWSHPLSSGLPVTLEAKEESALLDFATVETLAAMAQTPGATFTLTWDDLAMTVLFRHHEPPALACTPLWPGHDLFTGTIKLIKV